MSKSLSGALRDYKASTEWSTGLTMWCRGLWAVIRGSIYLLGHSPLNHNKKEPRLMPGDEPAFLSSLPATGNITSPIHKSRKQDTYYCTLIKQNIN